MAVVLRLKRTGAKNNSCFRIVAMDRKSTRDGRAVEELGFYNPRQKDEKCDLERAQYWISVGAQPSDTVKAIIKRAEDGIKLSDKVKKAKPSKKALAKLEAAKEAKAEEKEKAKAEVAEKVVAEKVKAEATEKAEVKEEVVVEKAVAEETVVAEEAKIEKTEAVEEVKEEAVAEEEKKTEEAKEK
jgi:small subunit ribosomal protein S16